MPSLTGYCDSYQRRPRFSCPVLFFFFFFQQLPCWQNAKHLHMFLLTQKTSLDSQSEFLFCYYTLFPPKSHKTMQNTLQRAAHFLPLSHWCARKSKENLTTSPGVVSFTNASDIQETPWEMNQQQNNTFSLTSLLNIQWLIITQRPRWKSSWGITLLLGWNTSVFILIPLTTRYHQILSNFTFSLSSLQTHPSYSYHTPDTREPPPKNLTSRG